MKWLILLIGNLWFRSSDVRLRIAEKILLKGLLALRCEHVPSEGLDRLLFTLGLKRSH